MDFSPGHRGDSGLCHFKTTISVVSFLGGTEGIWTWPFQSNIYPGRISIHPEGISLFRHCYPSQHMPSRKAANRQILAAKTVRKHLQTHPSCLWISSGCQDQKRGFGSTYWLHRCAKLRTRVLRFMEQVQRCAQHTLRGDETHHRRPRRGVWGG